MIDPMTLTAHQILSISVSAPEKIFSISGFSTEIKRMRGKWHPDVNKDPQAQDVFVHLMELASVAKSKIDSNSWVGNAQITFTSQSSGKQFNFRYKKMHSFELGKMYISDKYVMYVIDEANMDLYQNGVSQIKGIKYPDSKLKKEFERFMPHIKFNDATNIGNVVLIEKTKDIVLLQDLIDAIPGNKIEPIHVAWITSSLYNITMFLDHIGISHNSILPSTVFVNIKRHGVFLLGGWWYSVKVGGKLKALPSQLMKMLPSKILDEKKAKTIYDRQSIKGISVYCLGDTTFVGSKLLANKAIPSSMVTWLRTPSGSSAIDEFSGWYNLLDDIFGKREFIAFDFNTNNIYS